MNSSYLIALVLLKIINAVFSKIAQDTSILTVPIEDQSKEPSCEELRKMWRHTKREMQQQQSEIESPRFKTRYHEPFSYGWKAQARPRNAIYSKPVYGHVVHSPDKFLYRNSIPNRYRSFHHVARMVGSSDYYMPPLSTPQQTTFFRIGNPVRRPVMPVRISPVGRFQELQNMLRNERANEMQMIKLKGPNEADSLSSNSGYENSNSSYDTYRFPQSSEDDVNASNLKGRKLRETDENSSNSQVMYSEKMEEEENSSLYSTNKPSSTEDDSIPRRWALGEWKKR